MGLLNFKKTEPPKTIGMDKFMYEKADSIEHALKYYYGINMDDMLSEYGGKIQDGILRYDEASGKRIEKYNYLQNLFQGMIEKQDITPEQHDFLYHSIYGVSGKDKYKPPIRGKVETPLRNVQQDDIQNIPQDRRETVERRVDDRKPVSKPNIINIPNVRHKLPEEQRPLPEEQRPRYRHIESPYVWDEKKTNWQERTIKEIQEIIGYPQTGKIDRKFLDSLHEFGKRNPAFRINVPDRFIPGNIIQTEFNNYYTIEEVKKIQNKVGVEPTGKWDKATDVAVSEYNKNHLIQIGIELPKHKNLADENMKNFRKKSLRER